MRRVQVGRQGIGGCYCARDGGDPATGQCRNAVRDDRPLYWTTAAEVFGLPDRADGKPCPRHPCLPGGAERSRGIQLRPDGGLAVFGLIYDAENPYFRGCAEWPGWPAALHAALDGAPPDLRFGAVSWQELIGLLELDDDVRDWAREKHGLG